jgi:hypothetical protein
MRHNHFEKQQQKFHNAVTASALNIKLPLVDSDSRAIGGAIVDGYKFVVFVRVGVYQISVAF